MMNIDEINETNKIGYNKIAMEFDDKHRPTTKNFHELSIPFFDYILSNVIEKKMKVLEVGAGNGWLRKRFRWPEVDYLSVDIAENMEGNIVASVDSLPFADESFDYVFSSLGDPFFYKEALQEICRVLKTGGKFIFSTPDYEWASQSRGTDMMNTFSKDGKKVAVYSFTYNNEQMREVWGECGFHPFTIQQWYPEMLQDEIAGDIAKVWRKKCNKSISVITTAIFEK